MSEPTSSRDWATDPTAKKVQASTSHKDIGWTTSNGLITGKPEKPTMEVLNGWHNAVTQWLDWMDGKVDVDAQLPTEALDLWQWDTVSYPISGTSISQTAGGLRWFDFSAGIGAAQPWDDYLTDNQFGGMYWEAIDILNKGLGIQIIDSLTQTWLIYADQVVPPATFGLAGNKNTGISREFSIPATSDGGFAAGIVIVKDGVVVQDFVGFGTLNDASIFTHNTDGIRVVAPGAVKYQDRYVTPNGKTYLKGKAPKKRWIRPIKNTAGFTSPPDERYYFRLQSMKRGRRYKIWMSLEGDGGSGNLWELMLGFNYQSFTQKIYEVTSGLGGGGGETTLLEQEFLYENYLINQNGLEGINFGGTSIGLSSVQTNIDVQYADGNMNEMYMILEELS